MSDPKLLDAYYVDGLVAATGSLSSDISTLQTATGVLRADIDSNDSDISTLQTATGTLQQATGKALGSDTQIQFNDNGNLNGSSNLTWDGSNLYVNGTISGANVTGSYFYFSSGIIFDTSTGYESAAAGEMNWNTDEQTVNLGLNGEVTAQLGLETLMRVKAQEVIRNGMAVYAAGQVGGSDNIEVSRFRAASGDADELYFVGIATQDFDASEEGFITTFGKVRGVNADIYTNGGIRDDADTVAWSVGNILYASPNISGALTTGEPVAPDRTMPIAMVLKTPSLSNVTIFARAEHGYHLDEIHDVYTSSLQNGDILNWNSSSGRWENSSDIDLAGNIYSAQTISGNNILGQEITDLQTATGVLRADIDSNDTEISALQTATGTLRADIDSNDTDISALQTATGTLRGDIDSNDTDISALQTATGVLSQVSVTGSSSIHAPDLTGVGNVTVTLDGSTVKISGASAGGGTPAGSDNQIQFNNGGSFGASPNLTWDDNGLYVNGYISGQEISGSRFVVSRDIDFTADSQTGALSLFESTGLKTYPSIASFITSFDSKEIEIGTNQTINSTTPGGSNFLYADHNRFYKSAGSTGDLSRFYFTANRIYIAYALSAGCNASKSNNFRIKTSTTTHSFEIK